MSEDDRTEDLAAGVHGNGEIRVSSKGVVFAAPVLIVHYNVEHGYLPPAAFLQAVETLSF